MTDDTPPLIAVPFEAPEPTDPETPVLLYEDDWEEDAATG